MFAVCSLACAAGSRPPATAQPDAAVSGYPATLAASEERRASAREAWSTFAGAQGVGDDAPAPEFQPLTATVRTIAPVTASSVFLRLPRVGAAGGGQTEEQTREALRRFIESARTLLGVDPADVSLLAIETRAGGAKSARYRQQPFTYNLRGGYGEIEIVFLPDGRVTELSSTALPEADRLRRALATIRPRVSADEARLAIVGQTFTRGSRSSGGITANAETVVVGDRSAVTVRELVIYPIARVEDSSTLEFHLAWEISVTSPGAPDALIYLDAVRNEIIIVEAE